MFKNLIFLEIQWTIGQKINKAPVLSLQFEGKKGRNCRKILTFWTFLVLKNLIICQERQNSALFAL